MKGVKLPWLHQKENLSPREAILSAKHSKKTAMFRLAGRSSDRSITWHHDLVTVDFWNKLIAIFHLGIWPGAFIMLGISNGQNVYCTCQNKE